MDKKQVKYKFNIIDFLIILMIIAIGVVMYYYTVARNAVNANSEVEIEYVVELKTVSKECVDNISIGDKVVETVRDQQIGTVKNVSVTPAYVLATNTETGESFKSYYPPINADTVSNSAEYVYDYYNVRVTIKDTVKKSVQGYNVNGFDIAVGEVVNFRVPHFVNEGYCIDIIEK